MNGHRSTRREITGRTNEQDTADASKVPTRAERTSIEKTTMEEYEKKAQEQSPYVSLCRQGFVTLFPSLAYPAALTDAA